MSADATPGGIELTSGSSKPGAISKIKQWLISAESEFSFAKKLTFLGFLGSLIAAYFQYLSTYRDKVEIQAKEDLAAAIDLHRDIKRPVGRDYNPGRPLS
jgi:hypothetical protein